MKIGEIIRIFRMANEYSIKQLSEISNLTSAYIPYIENGDKNPSFEALEKMAKCFNVKLSEFFQIYEFYNENNGDFKKTLVEVLKIYVSE